MRNKRPHSPKGSRGETVTQEGYRKNPSARIRRESLYGRGRWRSETRKTSKSGDAKCLGGLTTGNQEKGPSRKRCHQGEDAVAVGMGVGLSSQPYVKGKEWACQEQGGRRFLTNDHCTGEDLKVAEETSSK